MPRGDKTGPAGSGAMTGRGAGYCGGSQHAGYTHPLIGHEYGRGWGRGFGFGRGQGAGRGRRYRFFATGLPGWARGEDYGHRKANEHRTGKRESSAGDEVAYLEEQTSLLESSLATVRKRLQELRPEQGES